MAQRRLDQGYTVTAGDGYRNKVSSFIGLVNICSFLFLNWVRFSRTIIIARQHI